MGARHDYAINRMTLDFSNSGSVVVDCCWWRSFFSFGNGDGFLLRSLLFVFCKAICTIPNKQCHCGLFFPQRESLKRDSALCIVDTGDNFYRSVSMFGRRYTSVGQKKIASTKDMSKTSVIEFFASPEISTTWSHRKKNEIVRFEGNFADLADGRAFWTLIIASAERVKDFLLTRKFPLTRFNRTVHVLNKLNIVFARATIWIECVTFRKFSQLFHICLQSQKISYSGGEILDI